MPVAIADARHETTNELATGAACEETPSILRKARDQRSRAERREKDEVPWLSTVKLSWGLEVRLVNISSTGLLLESGSKLGPGNVTELKLSGPDTEVVVPVRFVRCEVADVNHVGVTYRTAATFEKAVTVLGPAPASSGASSALDPAPVSPGAGASSTPGPISHLLAQVAAEIDRDSAANLRTALERGIRQAVPVRNIQIREAPIVPNDGSESIYFSVSTRTGPAAILQAMFAAGHEPTDLEFRLLKAAAGLAAAVLEFDERR